MNVALTSTYQSSTDSLPYSLPSVHLYSMRSKCILSHIHSVLARKYSAIYDHVAATAKFSTLQQGHAMKYLHKL